LGDPSRRRRSAAAEAADSFHGNCFVDIATASARRVATMNELRRYINCHGSEILAGRARADQDHDDAVIFPQS